MAGRDPEGDLFTVKLTGDRGKLVETGRRAWGLVEPAPRRRLRLVAVYGILIAGLDTFALILVYALISVLSRQRVSGIVSSV